MSDHTPIRDGNYTAIKCDGSWYILKYIGSNNLPSPHTTSLLEIIGGEADGVAVIVPQEVAFSLTYFEKIDEVDFNKIESYDSHMANPFRKVSLKLDHEQTKRFDHMENMKAELHSALRKDKRP